MNTIRLERHSYSPLGTFGTLWLPDNEFIYTVERPWLDNLPRISCIPEGIYHCVSRRYNRGGYPSIHVINVPDRSYILMHKGNTMHNVEGCIAVGTELGCINDMWAIKNSALAYEMLMEYANKQFNEFNGFKLEITTPP